MIPYTTYRDVDQLNDADLSLLRRHAGREMFAAVCVARRCFVGVKFLLESKPARPVRPNRADQCYVFEIDGQDGFYIGIRNLMGRLRDLGETHSECWVAATIKAGQPVGGRTIRVTGIYHRSTKKIVPVDPIDKEAA